MSTGATILLIIAVLAVLLAVGWFVSGRMRSQRLRARFGPEYDRRVEKSGDRRAAERELTELRKRHASLELRPLPEAARARFAEQWTLVQERFVDHPREAVGEAETLVQTVMRERGYPVDGFDQQVEDLSVEHGDAAGHYRSGHDIRGRVDNADVSTEELRQAMVHYRAVFASLTDAPADPESDVDGKRRYDDAAR